MSDAPEIISRFDQLNLPEPLLAALNDVGYETPSPIQAQAIPSLLEGRDLLGHAPTGTGKTAAFAIPLLARLDLDQKDPQIMVLAPTRELAIQVAEAFQKYASHMKGFHVLPIYGGQGYGTQLRQLKRGVHVIVGTPGRVMDHMRSGKLRLDGLKALVLDEADEMLRMGFIDDVEWILGEAPDDMQVALFSATMPREIKRIADSHLDNPAHVSIKSKTATAETIRQRYWLVSGFHKLDALTRILEVEPFDAILIFVRTKIATVDLAQKLEARGYAASAINGDLAQPQREKMIDQLKNGRLDILVATDVAARGLDVERISHVINYDIPNDTEAYIHRIGRTGRAGRTGDAILFVAPRERRMLGAIERATRQDIQRLELPTAEVVNNKRIADFKQKITDTLAEDDLGFMRGMIEQYQAEHDVPGVDIAAALAKQLIGDRPMLLAPDRERPRDDFRRDQGNDRGNSRGRSDRHDAAPAKDMDRYRIELGHKDRVQPGNIVGAIANESGLNGRYIGNIDIRDNFTLVDLPAGMPKEVFHDLKEVKVLGKRMNITRFHDDQNFSKKHDKFRPKKKRFKKPDNRKKKG